MFRLDVLPALAEDAPLLSEICVAAKEYWGYPEEWMGKWSHLLTVTPGYIQDHSVYKAVREGQVVGWYALIGRGTLSFSITSGSGQSLFVKGLVERFFSMPYTKPRSQAQPGSKSNQIPMPEVFTKPWGQGSCAMCRRIWNISFLIW